MPLERPRQAASHDAYFGFKEAPFSLTPNPKFAYSSHSHERALRTILHALSRHEGLLVVTGDIGCGKTTLCRRLLPLLPQRTFLSLVLNPFLTADDLLKQVLEDYGVVSPEESRRGSLSRASCHELARTLQDFLNSLAQIDGTAVIIVDESQNLPLRTLEQIRLLSNFETPTRKLLQIILVGQRNLEPILELEELRQLNQRVSRRCRIEPLAPREVSAYVEHRLSAAMPENEPPRVRFTAAAFNAVARLSHGVPRIINLLCDRALELAHAGGQTTIDRRTVLAAADDLELPVPNVVRLVPTVSLPLTLIGTRAAAAAAMIAAVAVGVVAFRGGRPVWGTSSAPTVRSETGQAATQASTPSRQLEPALAVETPAAAPVAAPPPVEPSPQQPPSRAAVVETAGSYELTVASFETAGRARTVAADLVAQGHPARAASSESGRWHMVIVGPFTTLNEANDAKNNLERAGFAGIRVAKSL